MRLRATRLSAISNAVRSVFRGALDGLSESTKAALIHIGGGRRALKTYPADGPIVRVRRSTDNAETDIGALKSGAIDAAAAASFAGAGDLFVVSGYDQRVTSIEARKNLFSWTEDFANDAWQKMPGITAVSAPDGWWKITQGNTTTVQRILGKFVPAFATERISLDAKAAEETVLAIGVGGIGFAMFDLVAGTHTPPQPNVYGHAMTPLPGGGYRCSVTFRNTTADAGAQDIAQRFWGVYQGTPGHGLFLRRPQSEAGEIETAYQRVDDGTEFPKRFVGAVLDSHELTQSTLEAQPRLMILPHGGRRNLLTESLSYKAWVFNHSTSPSSTDISSDGDIVGWEIPVGATGFNQRNYTIGTAPAPRSYFWSVIVEARDPATAVISFSTNGFFGLPGNIAADAVYTFATGGFVGSNPQVIALGNGRVRLVQRFDLPANASGVFVMRVDSQTATNGNVIFSGAQLEVGALTDYQRVDASGTIVYEQGRNHAALMLFDGTSDFISRPASDFPANLHTLPTVGPSYLTGPSSDFSSGLGSWLPLGGQAVLTASGGVAQLTGVSDYSSRAYLNFGGVLGKSLVFEMDIWSNSGNVTVNIQRPDAPFTDYARAFFRSTTPRRIQLYIPNIPVDAVNLQITPWSGDTGQIIYFDNVTIRDISPTANVGVTVATRISPQTSSVGAIWSMRDNSNGHISLSRNVNGTLLLEHRSNDTGSALRSASTTSAVAVGATATVVARWNFVTGTASVRINGTQENLLSGMDIGGGLTARIHRVGASNPSGSVTNFYGGAMTPPIIINAHASNAECQIIEQALGATV